MLPDLVDDDQVGGETSGGPFGGGDDLEAAAGLELELLFAVGPRDLFDLLREPGTSSQSSTTSRNCSRATSRDWAVERTSLSPQRRRPARMRSRTRFDLPFCRDTRRPTVRWAHLPAGVSVWAASATYRCQGRRG